jgi:TPR repeat protein
LNGRGIGVDFGKAAHYFKLAADQGHADGQVNYGDCLFHGRGIAVDFGKAAHYFKLAADQGHADGQFNYGHCLFHGRGIRRSFGKAAHYFKLAADQGHAGGQVSYGNCLLNPRGIGVDVKSAVLHFKLAADQGNARGQCRYAECLEKGIGIEQDLELAMTYYKYSADQGDSEAQCIYGLHFLGRDIEDLSTAVRYLSLSAAGGNAKGQFNIGHLLEEGIGIEPNHFLAVQYYELSSESLPSASAFYGWCLQNGRGVPVNFAGAAETFQRAADFGNADGENSLGVCLDLGRGIEKDSERSVSYYRKAASKHHASGMNNFGRCLECGQSTETDLLRAAKYYRLSAELKNAEASNNFGISLERGLGVKVNLDLAAEYYRRSADSGHADGSNNFGFCLEHGRGVCQDIKLAAEYYKQAADLGHPEAEQNYRRCLRLVGRWSVPDRSSVVSEERPSFDERQVDAADRIRSSLEAFSGTKQLVQSIKNWHMGGQLGKGELSIVTLAEDRQQKVKRAVKTLSTQEKICYFERDGSIHAQLNHPLIVGFEGYIPGTETEQVAIVTEFVPNGSLADHLPWVEHSAGSVVTGETRIAIIVTGIVLAMRYLHWRGIIHRDLKPANILVDWDWIVRIGDFSHSVKAGEAQREAISDQTLSIDGHYTAPECFEGFPTQTSDVFSFGLILCELLSGEPGFPPALPALEVMKKIVLDDARPPIPDYLHADAKQLILDCWAQDPDERPSFSDILYRLEDMDFQITRDVKSVKVRRFVEAVKAREKVLGIAIDDFD